MACGNNENEPINQLATKFAADRHDPILDQQIQPLLNYYFGVMDHLEVQDSADLVLYGSNMILLADSLTQKKLSLDTAIQNKAVQGLMNIQYEMSAILMESSPEERIMGAQMLSLQWIDFLAAIGYQKQTIYLFTDKDENYWMGLKNKESNPYENEGEVKYNPVQVLQELK
jgi:hypothetical protein